MKKILSILLALSFVGALRAAETSNVDYGQSTTAPTLTLVWQYETKAEGGVTYAVITGLRDDESASPSGAITVPTTVYDGSNGYVVKAIADGAFKDQIGITSITIPLTVQTIGSGVFTGCTVLSAITVDSANPWFTSADGVLYDKDRTRLVACPATTETVALPSSLKTIGVKAFANCHRLPAITIPAAVTEIGQYAFVGCTLLESLTFKGNAPTADATISDNPGDIVIYKEKSSTGWDAALWNSFKKILDTTVDPSSKILTATSGNLTWSYRIVGDGAELYNEGDAVIPAGTSQTFTYDAAAKTWVGDGTLNIPSELGGYPVTRIGVRAFRNCSALTTVNIPASATVIDDYAFENCKGISEITLTEAVEELGVAPFSGTSIRMLNIPINLKTLHGNPVAGCLNLTTLTVDSLNRYFTATDNVLYNRRKNRLYGIQTYVEDFTVPASVEWIASNAFSSCTLLTKITYLGNAPVLEDDGQNLYAEVPDALISYTAAGTTGWDGSSTTNLPASGMWPLIGPNQRRIISLYTPDGGETPSEIHTSGDWRYRIVDGGAEIWNNGQTAYLPETAPSAITVPTTLDGLAVVKIGEGALANFPAVTSISIPAAVRSIDTASVTNLPILASFSVSDGNPYYASSTEGALYDKDATTLLRVPATCEELSVPATVTRFGKNAFAGCYRMKKVNFAGNAPEAADGDNLYLDAHASLTNYVAKGNTTFGALPGTWHLRPVTDYSTPAEEGVYTETTGGITWTFKIVNGVAIINKAEQTTTGDVEIPPTLKNVPVTTIDYSTFPGGIFTDVDKATGVTIPSSITNIGHYAFYECSLMTYVDLTAASNLEYIGGDAFYGCSMLTTLEIPQNCRTIDSRAFSGCTSLTDVILPGEMTSLGYSAFYGCTLLQSVTLPTNLTMIARSTFQDCSALKSITLPRNLKSISQYAFEDCSTLETVTLPNTVTQLGAYSFNGCSSLTEVNFEGGLPAGLKNSHILDHVTNVNCPEALYDTYRNWLTANGYTCTVNKIGEPEKELKTDGTWYYHVIDGYAELWCTNGAGENVSALVDRQTTGALALPTSIDGYLVKGIAPLAVANLRGITLVTVPGTYESIGDFAFSNDTSLASITLNYGLRTIGKRPFVNTIIEELELPDSLLDMYGNIAAGALFLNTIKIGDSSHFAYSTDGNCLYNKDKTRLYACSTRAEGTTILPATLTEILPDAFFGCFRLSYLNIPAKVSKIGSQAFNVSGLWSRQPALEATPKLTIVVYQGTKPIPNAADDIYSGAPENLKSYAFYDTWTGDTWKGRALEVTKGTYSPTMTCEVEGIEWSFRIVDNSYAEIYNEGEAAIPTSTADGVLDMSTGTKGVEVPSALYGYPVNRIGDGAFKGCALIKNLFLPSTISEIGDRAFENCTALRSVCDSTYIDSARIPEGITLPEGVEKLGYRAFDGATKLQQLTIPASLTSLTNNPIAGCRNINAITVTAENGYFIYEDGVLYDSGKTVVIGCLSTIKSLTLPETVTSLGDEAFADCGLLTSVEALCEVPTAPDNVFEGTPADLVVKAESESLPTWKPFSASGTWKGRAFVDLSDPEAQTTYTDANGVEWHYTVTNGIATLTSVRQPNDAAILSLTLPNSIKQYVVKGIGDGALANLRGITSITIPDTYESIGDSAFSNCTALSSVKIGAAVTEIGRWPFYGTKITSLEIPASVTAIDGNPVAGASMLSTLTVADGSTHFATYDGALYDRALTTLLACPATKTSLTTPETLTDIADDAFYGCGDIAFGGGTASGALTWSYYASDNQAIVTNISGTATTVTIPKTLGGFPVSKITTDALNGLSGVKAFVSMSDAYAARNGVLYTADGTHLVRVPDQMTLPYTVTTNTTKVTYAITTVTASSGASISTNITSKTTTPVTVKVAGDVSAKDLLAGVTAIDNYAFRGCNLFSNTSGSSVQTVGSPATMITEEGSELVASVTTTQESVNWKETYETILSLPATVTTVGSNATTDSGVTLKYNGDTTTTSEDPYSEDPETPLVTLAASLVSEDPDAMDVSLANTYNGLIVDAEGQTLGTIKVTTAKATGKAGAQTSRITASIKMAGETKTVTLRGAVDPTSATGSWTATDGRVLALTFTRNSMTGTFDENEIEGIRNVFSLAKKTTLAKTERATAESVLATLKKNYTLAFASGDGWGALSISVRTKGAVYVAGKLADGTSLSLSSQLLVGDSLSCIPVVYTKKSTTLAFSIYFANDGSETTVIGLDEATIAPVGNLDEGLAFSVDAGVNDLWSDCTLLDEFLPEGVSVEQTGKSKWTVAGGAKSGTIKLVEGEAVDTRASANPSALRLTFSSATGVFRGSFKVYTLDAKGKLKTFTASVYGVVVDGYGYGTATISRRGTFAIAIVP